MRYLDPKNDLTFKKVFGQHPDLLKSFLNALMPLEEGQVIDSLEYLPAELVPEIPEFKHSIVDVRCRDNRGRTFIVEMQMLWTDSFKYRVLFNASKAYVKQLERGKRYESLQPVYALNLVNEIFEKDTEKFYHHYAIVHTQEPNRRLEGLSFVFVELPKFKPETISHKRMMALWLRYMTEIQDGSEKIAPELIQQPELKKAIDILQESAFTKEELEYYDRYWDSISTERTLVEGALLKGMTEGLQKGMTEGLQKGMTEGLQKGMTEGLQKGMTEGLQKGLKEGIEQGIEKEKMEMAQKMKKKGYAIEDIIEMTGLTESQIASLSFLQ